MTKSLLTHFKTLEDPRIIGLVTYPLPELLLGALVGVMCGAGDFEEIVLVCEEKIDFLRKFLPYANGIASPDTFQRVFDLLDAKVFSECFSSWIASLIGHVEGVVAIDGKTIRGALQPEGRALHVLSAYAHEAGLVLAQRVVDAKSNEIAAIIWRLRLPSTRPFYERHQYMSGVRPLGRRLTNDLNPPFATFRLEASDPETGRFCSHTKFYLQKQEDDEDNRL